MWKPNCGEKPRQPTSCTIHYEGEIQQRESTEATTSLSLSIAVTIHTRYTTTKVFNNYLYVCPKSYLYTYDFRAIYTYGPKGPTIGREDHHRALDHPVLLSFPVGETCFPTKEWYDLRVFLHITIDLLVWQSFHYIDTLYV